MRREGEGGNLEEPECAGEGRRRSEYRSTRAHERTHTHRLEDAEEAVVINAVPQGEVERIVLAFARPHILCVPVGGVCESERVGG